MIKIVSPSHLRAGHCTTHKVVADVSYCVPKKQAGLYREHYPDVEIIEHPDSVVGISPKRQWIYEKFGDVFMVDDDVVSVRRAYLPPNHKKPPLKPSEVRDWIYDLYGICKDLNVFMFGVRVVSGLSIYDGNMPIAINTPISGGGIGLIKNDKIYFPDSETQLMEERFAQLVCIHYERMTIKDNRIAFIVKDKGRGVGGCSTIRNDNNIKKSALLLRKSFGNAVKTKGGKGEYSADVKMNIPI